MGAVAGRGEQTCLVKFLPLAHLYVPVGQRKMLVRLDVFFFLLEKIQRVGVRGASYLRSLSRAEMVVRRRPLSLLDSAVAIWYSSFSMEKGLAIRRHFRSCTQNQISFN